MTTIFWSTKDILSKTYQIYSQVPQLETDQPEEICSSIGPAGFEISF